MAAKIRRIVRDDNEMSNTDLDDVVTPGAGITLPCLIRLNWVHMVIIEVSEETGTINRDAIG